MEIIVISILIILNGLFALSEIAFVSSDDNKLKELAIKNKSAYTVLEIKKEADKFLSTIQVGITLIGIISGAFSGITLADNLALLLKNIQLISAYAYQISLIFIVITITYFSIIFGELIPKIFALKNPEIIIIRLINFIKILTLIMFPFVFLLTFSTKLFFKLIRIKNDSDENNDDLVKQILGITKIALMENKIEKEQEKIIKNTMKINKMKINEIMIEKKDIKYLSSDMNLMNALVEAHLHQHTRYPLFDNKKNEFIGYVSFKDIINVLKFNPNNPSILSIRRPMMKLNENEYVIGALKKMSKNFQHITLVVNSKNKITGLVTFEDIVETIVGDINDEYDFIPDYIYNIADNRFIAGGRIKISNLRKKVSNILPNINITLNDWLEENIEAIKTDSHFQFKNINFIIKKISRSRVYEVIIEMLKDKPH